MDERERRRRAADLEAHPELPALESIAESLEALAAVAPKIGEASPLYFVWLVSYRTSGLD